MALKHLLVHVDGAPRAAERVDLAAAVARRLGATLTGLFAESGQLGPSVVGRRSPQNVARAVADARALFDERAGAAGVAREWWQIEPGAYDEVVGWTVTCCRHADVAVLGQHDPEQGERVPADLVERVVFESGRPVLVVPSVGHYAEVGRRVLVAWTGSRESARAVQDALPFMQGADEVRVVSFQEAAEGAAAGGAPPVSVVAHLRTHGIDAKYERMLVDERGILDPVLNRGADMNADLTVLGAYPARGLLGGRSTTTRDILGTMTTPVLLSY